MDVQEVEKCDSPVAATPAKSIKKTQLCAGIAATLGHCCIGMTAAYTGMIIPFLRGPDSPIRLSDTQASWIGSLFPVGALITTLLAGPLMHRIGRKSVLLVAAVPYTISWLLLATAKNVNTMYFARILAGTCSGLILPTAQVYIAEISQAKMRGSISPFTQIMWALGVLISYTVGSFCNWRVLAGFSTLFPVMFFVSMLLIPKSPTWLISKKKFDEAKKAMEWLRGIDYDSSIELANIRKNLEETKHDIGHIKDLLQWKYLKPFLICTGLMIFQRLSGAINFIYYYGSLTISAEGSDNAKLSAIIVASSMLMGTIISTFILDKIGRRLALQLSAFLMTISLVILGTYFYFKQQPGYEKILDGLGSLPIITMTIFMFFFSLGYNPVPFVMVGELLPARIRGFGAGFILWMNMFVTSAWLQAYFPLIKACHHYGTFWLYSLLTFTGFLFAVFAVPETKRQTLEDIERKLGKRQTLEDIERKLGKMKNKEEGTDLLRNNLAPSLVQKNCV